jgi:hypothetical protein
VKIGGMKADLEELLSRAEDAQRRTAEAQARAQQVAARAAEAAQGAGGCQGGGGASPAGGVSPSGGCGGREPVAQDIQQAAREATRGRECAARDRIQGPEACCPPPSSCRPKTGIEPGAEGARSLERVAEGAAAPKKLEELPGAAQKPLAAIADAVPAGKVGQDIGTEKQSAKPGDIDHRVPRGTGLDREWKQFREIDEQKLRETLPDRAKHLSKAFIDSGRKHDVDPVLLAAISRHETGNWTSKAFQRGNAMGISGSGGPRSFARAEDSIEKMAKQLASPTGYYKNADTLRQLWSIYAPSSATGTRATNDPNNLNRHWGPAIDRYMTEIENRVL